MSAPLLVAVIAFGMIAGLLAAFRNQQRRAVLAIAAGMVIFFQASRIALVRFDPYLGSHALATALQLRAHRTLIREDNAYADLASALRDRSRATSRLVFSCASTASISSSV